MKPFYKRTFLKYGKEASGRSAFGKFKVADPVPVAPEGTSEGGNGEMDLSRQGDVGSKLHRQSPGPGIQRAFFCKLRQVFFRGNGIHRVCCSQHSYRQGNKQKRQSKKQRSGTDQTHLFTHSHLPPLSVRFHPFLRERKGKSVPLLCCLHQKPPAGKRHRPYCP